MSTEPIWSPNSDQRPSPQIHAFTELANQRTGRNMVSYNDLWRWSVNDLEGFWGAVWDFFDVIADEPYTEVLADRSMPGAEWFPGTHVNYAEHALRAALDERLVDEPAIITITEDGNRIEVTWRELRRQVGSVSAWLRGQGVEHGDRVVGYLPNTHHTLVAFLASASIGAIWSACAQDYAAEGAATKLGQLEPTVLFAADGYFWNGTGYDRRDQVADLATRIPSLRAVVGIGNLGVGALDEKNEITNLSSWDAIAFGDTPPEFVRIDFDTPLWVLYSSGTTGIPKGIVHSHGGVVVDHLRLFGLHLDLRPGDRFFWYTNTNWMMWNLVASALLAGATTVCFDGSPLYPGPGRLWEIAADTKANVLGVSPGDLPGRDEGGDRTRHGVRPDRAADDRCHRCPCARQLLPMGARCRRRARAAGLDERRHGRRQRLRRIRAELSESGLASSRGRCSVWRWSPGMTTGSLLVGEVGEMVITAPMPSMPVKFWNDPDGSATATRTSRCSPESGATATGSRSPTAAASSSPAARTPPSTGRACAWAAPTSTTSSTASPRWPNPWSSVPSSRTAGTGCRCSSCWLRRRCA